MEGKTEDDQLSLDYIFTKIIFERLDVVFKQFSGPFSSPCLLASTEAPKNNKPACWPDRLEDDTAESRN